MGLYRSETQNSLNRDEACCGGGNSVTSQLRSNSSARTALRSVRNGKPSHAKRRMKRGRGRLTGRRGAESSSQTKPAPSRSTCMVRILFVPQKHASQWRGARLDLAGFASRNDSRISRAESEGGRGVQVGKMRISDNKLGDRWRLLCPVPTHKNRPDPPILKRVHHSCPPMLREAHGAPANRRQQGPASSTKHASMHPAERLRFKRLAVA